MHKGKEKARKGSTARPRAAKPKDVPAKQVLEGAAAKPTAQVPPTVPEALNVIGVGASAGGLEALESFLEAMPLETQFAIVVVQHLGPQDQGMLVNLLSRVTKLPVVQIKNRMRIEANHVYVAPARVTVQLKNGLIILRKQVGVLGQTLPIDLFFRSLADELAHQSVGVILSGTGTDGTLGLKAIHEKAGGTFVQDPTHATFDGMPRSAIATGCVDVVGSAADLPQRIIAFQHGAAGRKTGARLDGSERGALELIFAMLRAQTGNDFSLYKTSTIHRRIERRMALHQISDLEAYSRFLRENADEVHNLFRELLINVTQFYRDPEVWDFLIKNVIPDYVKKCTTTQALRAWVPGCATGEEAFTLAMAFKEALGASRRNVGLRLQIFATDIDKESIDKARTGLFPVNIAADVSADRLARFFSKEEDGYRISKEIREMVIFAPQNMVTDPPFTRLDFLCCRNLLIYLSAELQRKILPLFHYSLRPGGIMLLGNAETIGAFSNIFGAVDNKLRLYHRSGADESQTTRVTFPSPAQRNVPDKDPPVLTARPRSVPPNLQSLVDRTILTRFSPVGILCSEHGEILYTSGRVAEFLELAVGKPSLNIFDLAREGLRFDLSSAFAAANRQTAPIEVRGIKVGASADVRPVNLTVQKLAEPQKLAGTVMVLINYSAADTKALDASDGKSVESSHLRELETENQRRREEIQTVREEMQTSQEELKSTNEELQSTNEELQSTNEELTTSKEELQSLNEELQTVNAELQAKVDELSRANNDMKNLLNSTEIATLFLDGDLKVRRFTKPVTKIIKLIPGDAGRPISDMASNLDYCALAEDAQEVLQTLVFRERHISTRDGQSYMMRIMPYRTLDNVIEGVVITFTNTFGASPQANGDSSSVGRQSAQLLESIPTLIWTCDASGRCDYLSRQWSEYCGLDTESLGNDGWFDQAHPQDLRRLKEAWNHAKHTQRRFEVQVRLRGTNAAYRWFQCRAESVTGSAGQVLKWFGTATDVERMIRRINNRDRHTEQMFADLAESCGHAVINFDVERCIQSTNEAARSLFNAKEEDIHGQSLDRVLKRSVNQHLLDTVRMHLRRPEDAGFESEKYHGSDNIEYHVHMRSIGAGGRHFVLIFQKQP